MTKAEFNLINEALTTSTSPNAAFCMGIVWQMAWNDSLAADRSLLEDCNQVDLALAVAPVFGVTLDTLYNFCEKLYRSWKESRCQKTTC
jgi:hypothetical protein